MYNYIVNQANRSYMFNVIEKVAICAGIKYLFV